MIKLTTVTQDNWLLKVTPRTKVKLTGTAKPDMLRPGIFVRFTAAVDKRKSKVQEKVSELTIFTPSRQDASRMPGVSYPGQEGGVMPQNVPMPMPQNVPMPPNAAKQPKADAKDNPTTNVETFEIRGRVTKYRSGRLTVYAPNRYFKPALTIELDEEPIIKLDLANYSAAKPGDAVTAKGIAIAPKMVEAMELTIELAKPLTRKREKPKRPTTRRPATKRTPGQSKREGDGRPAFGVADQLEKEKPAGEDKKAATEEARMQQIVKLLEDEPERTKGRTELRIRLGEGDVQIFTPSKQIAGQGLRDRFGKPDGVRTVSGSLPVGEGNANKKVKWELWSYGRVKIFVDEAGTVQYFRVQK